MIKDSIERNLRVCLDPMPAEKSAVRMGRIALTVFYRLPMQTTSLRLRWYSLPLA